MHRTLGFAAALVLIAPASAAVCQDVEMLGERYGTPVPDGYRRSMLEDPSAFQFRRAWVRRGVSRSGVRSSGRGDDPAGDREAFAGGAPLARVVLGRRAGPVVGTFRIPVLLGLYSNSGGAPPFSQSTFQDAYFGAGPGTITEYYTEVSGARVTLLGDTQPWVTTARPDTSYTVDESGLVGGALGGGGAGNFIYDLLALQVGVDWGPYDNDGPDGAPNSGDDDGIVDVLAVIHPTRGGECAGPGSADRIWSHRWSLSAALGTRFTTTTARTGGGFIEVDDYTIQAAIACSGGGLNPIGVFTHELGHAFGLPDLYDTDATDGKHSGAGTWDLMASGSWGCDHDSPESPCHLGAWSKEMLGWLNVVTLGPGLDHGRLSLPPVETTGSAFRIDANDGSGEYFLVENRQRLLYDQNLHSEGLLIWQIDDDWIAARWAANEVNARDHMGVWLRQADGAGHLGNGQGRGDAGDPFPGQTGNAAFHAATTPSPVSYLGGFTGVTIYDIQPSGVDDMSLSVTTRLSALTVRADGTSGNSGIFTVDGLTVDPPATTFLSAPFSTRSLEAAAGEAVQQGERIPFIEWTDDPGGRIRTVVTPVADTEYVARYGGTQYQALITPAGGVAGVSPGSVLSTPVSADLWFDAGASVSLEARPQTGFSFLGWTGDLLGQPNPAAYTASAPLIAGADFELIYEVPPTAAQFPAATELDIQLETENGSAPFLWALISGTLPDGLELASTGRITGAALETGDFDLTVEAVDALGLPASGTLTLQLSEPTLSIEALAAPLLLSGPPLTVAESAFVDRRGNGIAPYDVGDFRAWVLSHPELPLSADFVQAPQARITVRTSPVPPKERR